MTPSNATPLFTWETLNTIIGGVSAIDIPRLHTPTPAAAEDFLRSYGFDVNDEADRAEISRLRGEAVALIDEVLLPGSAVSMPNRIREQRDLRQIMVWASATQDGERQRWSCALLRVVHTFAHCQSYFNLHFGRQIRAQILARFEPHLHKNDRGWRLGSGPDAVDLVRFEVKHGKELRSLAIKLLQKYENVATDIFDRVGVRFVTHRRFDALLVVRYLRAHNLVMFANIKPSRSRNTLIDIEAIRADLESLTEADYAQPTRLEALRERVDGLPFPGGPMPGINPHSSSAYHAIQFTCRQHIRVANPYAPESLAVLDDIDSSPVDETQSVRALRDAIDEEIGFFFPYEVQILDQQAYDMSHYGRASHAVYKRRQLDAVRRRVMGALLD